MAGQRAVTGRPLPAIAAALSLAAPPPASAGQPVAAAAAFTTNEDTAAAVAVLANDTDPDAGTTLTATLIGSVSNGTLALQPNGSFTYSPAANFNGTATFTYQARDGSASSSTVTMGSIARV